METQIESLINNSDWLKLIGVIVGVFVVIVTFALLLFWQKRKSAGRNILITGLSDSGKTTIYSHLIHSKIVETYTSVIDNIGEIRIQNNTLRVVDIPGHERVRYKYFDKHKSSVKGLVYMINSATIQKEIRDVAEFLYNLLSDSAVQKNINVLILCNKQDQTLAKSTSVIEALLVKELNLLRTTKTNELEATDASSTKCYLGKRGKSFDFNDLNCKVEFAECSTQKIDSEKSIDISQLQKWLKKII